MDKIKPYAFWIVCGVILVIELIIMSLITPSHELAPGSTVESLLSRANSRFNDSYSARVPRLWLFCAMIINLSPIPRRSVLRTKGR